MTHRGMARASLLAAAGLALGGAIGGCAGPRGAYVNRRLRFMLKVPPGWTVQEYSGEPCLWLRPPGRAGSAGPNVNVIVFDREPGATLQTLADRNEEQTRHLARQESLGKETWTLADGRQAVVLEFRHAAFGDPMTVLQLTTVGGGRVYTVTATATAREFAALEPTFEACLRSLRVAW